jgi:hypothetical protein
MGNGWEGRDSCAHHLCVPLGDQVQARGITANSNDFASDFIFLDAQGREYHDDPRRLDNIPFHPQRSMHSVITAGRSQHWKMESKTPNRRWLAWPSWVSIWEQSQKNCWPMALPPSRILWTAAGLVEGETQHAA